MLHHWVATPCDGVVMAACWGCDNGLIAESLLRGHPDIPLFFYYDDATTLPERRLDAFVYRLQQQCPRESLHLLRPADTYNIRILF